MAIHDMTAAGDFDLDIPRSYLRVVAKVLVIALTMEDLSAFWTGGGEGLLGWETRT